MFYETDPRGYGLSAKIYPEDGNKLYDLSS